MLSNGPITAGSFGVSMINLSDHDGFGAKRNSMPRNIAFAPADPFQHSPGGVVHIDKTLDTYRTLKFDDNGLKKQGRGPTIAEEYSKQAEKMARIKKQQAMLRMG